MRQPRGIRCRRKSIFLKEEKPVCGSFLIFVFCYWSGGAVGFTRRNDASQPRIHPASPQRDRLFGKKRVGVGKSHTGVFTHFAPNYMYYYINQITPSTCVMGYGDCGHLRPKLQNSVIYMYKYTKFACSNMCITSADS